MARYSICPVDRTSRGSNHKKTAFSQKDQSQSSCWRAVSLGLLHHLLVVMMMVVMMMVVMTMSMVVTVMMLMHRGRISAGCPDNRHKGECSSESEGRDEGLFHGSFPFFAGRVWSRSAT
jgi:hypothetical protein